MVAFGKMIDFRSNTKPSTLEVFSASSLFELFMSLLQALRPFYFHMRIVLLWYIWLCIFDQHALVKRYVTNGREEPGAYLAHLSSAFQLSFNLLEDPNAASCVART